MFSECPGSNLLPFLILYLSSRSGQPVQAGMGFGGVELLQICSIILSLSLIFSLILCHCSWVELANDFKNTTTYPKEQWDERKSDRLEEWSNLGFPSGLASICSAQSLPVKDLTEEKVMYFTCQRKSLMLVEHSSHRFWLNWPSFNISV